MSDILLLIKEKADLFGKCDGLWHLMSLLGLYILRWSVSAEDKGFMCQIKGNPIG